MNGGGRIPVLARDEAAPDVRVFYDALAERFGRVPNIFAVSAHHPPALEPLLALFSATFDRSGLDPRLLELAVIRLSFSYQSEYCLTLHKAFALERGVPMAEIHQIIADPTHASFPEHERCVLDYVDQWVDDPLGVSDELFARLREHHSEQQIVALTLLMGLAQTFGLMANALRVPLDGGLPASSGDGDDAQPR